MRCNRHDAIYIAARHQRLQRHRARHDRCDRLQRPELQRQDCATSRALVAVHRQKSVQRRRCDCTTGASSILRTDYLATGQATRAFNALEPLETQVTQQLALAATIDARLRDQESGHRPDSTAQHSNRHSRFVHVRLRRSSHHTCISIRDRSQTPSSNRGAPCRRTSRYPTQGRPAFPARPHRRI